MIAPSASLSCSCDVLPERSVAPYVTGLQRTGRCTSNFFKTVVLPNVFIKVVLSVRSLPFPFRYKHQKNRKQYTVFLGRFSFSFIAPPHYRFLYAEYGFTCCHIPKPAVSLYFTTLTGVEVGYPKSLFKISRR